MMVAGTMTCNTFVLALCVALMIRGISGFATLRPTARVAGAHCSSCMAPQFSSATSRGWVKARQVLRQPSTRRVKGGVQGLAATLPSDLAGRERLEKFIEDCELLGPVRFVCMTDGAILESVGSFDNLRYSDQPKGRYATVSEGKEFECHVNMDKVKSIAMVTKKSPAGEHDLYITRFQGDNGETVLSAMLHAVDGVYEPGATDYWEKLRKTFGAEQSVA